jgi:hypothetical protein
VSTQLQLANIPYLILSSKTFQFKVFEQVEEPLCQLLNVCGVNDVNQTQTHKAEPLMPESKAF